jgi:simple sugar transport system substrate-binding protein
MNMKTILASAALAMTAATGALAEKTKVGFVYVGPVGDGGWTYEHDQGRKAVVEAFGDKVETMYVENVPEGPDAERVMTDMALKGADLIFTTSFGYMDPTINVAAKFPNVKFEHATGYKQADNVSVYSARFYEGRAGSGPYCGPNDQIQYHWLHWLLPNSRSDPRHQLCLYPRQSSEPRRAI